MPALKFCHRQEECPLLMGAVEAKVKLQSTLNVERMEWEAKRCLMNQLYQAARKLRTAQVRYFKSRLHEDLVKSRVAEADFDKLLARIRMLSRPPQPGLFDGAGQPVKA